MKKQKKNEKETLPLPFVEKKTTGKIQGKSCIAYSLSLPHLLGENFEESERFLDLLKDSFLTFLKKKSEEEWEKVMFGGLSFQPQDQKVHLLFCFSPFEERVFTPCATLFFSEEGKLLKILQNREKRRESI